MIPGRWSDADSFDVWEDGTPRREEDAQRTTRHEALKAARPFVESFLNRRGLWPRGQEADTLTGYVLEAVLPLIRAEAFEDAADELATRSEIFLKTMQNMADSREYKLEDIVRYGAFSAEANSTANRLRNRAATERGQG